MIKRNHLSYVVSSILLGITPYSIAQSDDDTAKDVEVVNVVGILGSRVAGRTATESTVPIDILSSEDILKGGAVQTVELLQQLVPSFNSFKNSITDATDYVRPAQLRGLGPEHTLVLVNGKRRHTSAVVHDNEQARGSVAVDLNSIPPGAISQIEVLRDGAAAQYGSDAVAGVINITLKRSTAFEANITYGQHDSNEDRGYRAGEGLNGSNTDESVRGQNAFIDWTDSTFSTHHNDGKSTTLNLSKGFEIGDEGYIGGSVQYWKQGRADRAGIDPTFQYFGKLNGEDVFVTRDKLNDADPANRPTLDPKEATIDREHWWFGKSELENISAMINADKAISESATAYAFTNYSRRTGRGPCFWRESASNNNVRAIHPDGYLPNVTPENDDLSVSAGVKGEIGEYNYDISSTYGKNDFNFKGETLNVSLGNDSPTSFDGGGSTFDQWTQNLDVNRKFDVGFSSPLNLAFGAEHRTENYTIYAGETAAHSNGGQPIIGGPNAGNRAVVGTQCVQSFFPVDETDQSRTSYAGYADLEADIVDGVTVSTAIRYENYSDFGDTLNFKLSGRIAATDVLAFRGSFSTGFRAPALQQQFYSNRSLQSSPSGDLVQTGTFTVESPTAAGLGAIPLEAEESQSLSFGATLELDQLKVTLDAYRVNVDDRVLLSEQFKPRAADRDAFFMFLDSFAGNDESLKGVQAANFFVNGLDTKTQGVDLIINYEPDFVPSGELAFTLATNLNKTEVERLADTPAELQPFTEQTLLGATNINNIEQAAPRQVTNFIADYRVSDVSFRWKSVYYGEITAAERFSGNNPENFQRYGGSTIHDLELRYHLLDDNLSFSLGANNLLDKYPSKRFKSQSKQGELPYSGYQPFGFLGRYVYTRIDYKFY